MIALDDVITMGCGNSFNQVHAKRRLNWTIPNPKQLSPIEFNSVRDEICERVHLLLTNLESSLCSKPAVSNLLQLDRQT